MPALETAKRDAELRRRVIDTTERRVLVSRIGGTAQEGDLSAPTNCGGYGRIRHFRRKVAAGWPENPLPIVPASRWLGIDAHQTIEAQVFQLAACAWRCWYCYVPYASMRADPATSSWRTAEDLVDDFLGLENRPPILDLSGGSPDLAPEWIAWTLEAIESRGAAATTFLWSDDNLSTDRLLRQEHTAAMATIAAAPNYGKACCLKGYDSASFAFNTRAGPEGFERQLDILTAYATTDIDIYVYLPLVGPVEGSTKAQVDWILDRLASIRSDLPSRTVPLLVSTFGAMAHRVGDKQAQALERQWELAARWQEVAPMALAGS